MSILSDALLNLKNELNNIAGRKLSFDAVGIENNITEAQKIFVDYELLPPDLATEYAEIDGIATSQEKDSYANKVIQAVWNIADLTPSSKMSALSLLLPKNKNSLIANFNFLDDITFTPKIIDEKTLQVGKVLLAFINILLTDADALHIIPTEDARNSTLLKINEMKEILSQRIATYEFHANKEKFSYAKELLEIKKVRRAYWDEKAALFNEHISNLLTTTLKNYQIIRDSSSSANLENYLNTIKQPLADLAQLKNEFLEFNHRWHQENTELEFNGSKLPQQVESSKFVNALVNQNNILNEWENLYNIIDDNQLYMEGIIEELDNIYNKALVNEISGFDNIESITETVNAQLRLVHEIIALQDYTSHLNGQLNHWVNCSDNLQTLPQAEEEIDKQILLSSHENPIQDLSENILSYKAFFAELFLQEQQLFIEKSELNQLLSSLADNELLSYKEFHNYQSFIDAITNHKEKLAQVAEKIDAQILQIGKAKEIIDSKIHDFNDELAKLDSHSRQEALEAASQNVNNTFQAYHGRSKPRLIEIQAQYSSFMEKYNEALEELTTHYSSNLSDLESEIQQITLNINQVNEEITTLATYVEDRKTFLEEALLHLKSYQQILDSDQEYYIPIHKIPQNDLKEYLEGDSSLQSFIDELYQNAEKVNQWYGFNLQNWASKASRLTSFGPSNEDYDLTALNQYLRDKIELVEAELNLSANYINKDNQSTALILPTNNLWSIHQTYELIIQQQSQFENKLKELQDAKLRMTCDKETEEAALTLRKNEFEQTLNEAQTLAFSDSLAHELAILAKDSLIFEYKLMEIKEKVSAIEPRFEQWIRQDNAVLILNSENQESDVSKIIKEDLQEIKTLFTFKPHFSLPSVDELHSQINDQLLALNKKLEQTEYFLPPTTISEKNHLDKKVSRLQEEYNQFNHTLMNKIAILPAIVELAKIEVHSKYLLSQISATTNQNLLLPEMQHFTQLITEFMEIMSKADNSWIKDKYSQTAELVAEVIQKQIYLENIAKLTRIEEAYTSFVERIESEMLDKWVLSRKKLLREIQTFEVTEGLPQTLAIIQNSYNSTFDQSKLEAIMKAQEKIDQFKDKYGSVSTTEASMMQEIANINKQLKKVRKNSDKLNEKYLGLFPTEQQKRQLLAREISAFKASELVGSLKEVDHIPYIVNAAEEIGKINKAIKSIGTDYIKERRAIFKKDRNIVYFKYFINDVDSKSVFGNYLYERAHTFWFRDFLSSVAALTLGIFGYKTESACREEYIHELQTVFVAYQNAESSEELDANFEILLAKINSGMKQFRPRAIDSDASLQSKLAKFELEVRVMHHDERIDPTIEREEMALS